jgi:hypothetical protein
MNLCGGLAFNSISSECGRLSAATDAIPLPQPKPRTVSLLLIVPPIRIRKISWSERSCVGHREHAFQPLDFSNGLFGVHPVAIIQEKDGNGQTGRQLRQPLVSTPLLFPSPAHLPIDPLHVSEKPPAPPFVLRLPMLR